MSHFTAYRFLAFVSLVLLLAVHPMKAQQKAGWTWKDAEGRTHTRAELDKILRAHEVWVRSDGGSGKKADLSNADLGGADLSGAILTHADLIGTRLKGATLAKARLSDAGLESADLQGANLAHADLVGAALVDANLNGADLVGSDLDGAVLAQAELVGTRLKGASLSKADLTYAHLTCADWLSCVNLEDADLSEAKLTSADLTGAHLPRASLSGADLRFANLTGASLWDADLSGAGLWSVDLTNADLFGADLSHTNFEPKKLPEMRGIAAARNLESITYFSYPDALVQVRKQFLEAGLQEQERKITYALKRREAELSWQGCKSRKTGEKTRAILWSSDSNLANCGAFVLNLVFFDWTCQYGMSPGRPLSLGVLVWVLCSILYFVCIHTSGEGGLYRVYAAGIRENPSETRRVERISRTGKIQAGGWRRIFRFLRRELLMLRASMFFSLMSAFNIGFRDINFGRWLRLLTRQEFDIKAVGWARVVAGWQSLLSVYFIALWVLTYFGRPFG